MSKKELLDWMVECLKKYKKTGVIDSLTINKHMNNYSGEIILDSTIDAILVDFVNFMAFMQGVDLALYTKDV